MTLPASVHRETQQPTGRLPDDVDLLPSEGVSDYVERYAQACHLAYQRNRLDDWAEAVTRTAGDEVLLDHTSKLLVMLKKQHLITGRQLARLLTNHLREIKRVRSVQGFPDGGLSPQH